MTDYVSGLERRDANYAALTPLSFLHRTAALWPERVSVIHGDRSYTWRETAARCHRFAAALAVRGIGPGDTVAVMAPNVPALLEAHFAVAMAGAVLAPLNVRLDADTIAFILGHGEAKFLLSDCEYAATVRDALALLGDAAPPVVDIADDAVVGGERLGGVEYEEFLATGDEDFVALMPAEEWSAITLNYTSGTTGRPKGVVYHHRGAYLNALGNSVTWDMGHHPVYLWTLPMFHCNGWCFPWTVTMLGGTHVCLRRVEAATIGRAVADHGVTHLCGAPVVMGMMLNAVDEVRALYRGRDLRMMTAGAPPPAAIIEGMEGLGIRLTHVYGLTETYGPVTVCAWHPEWDARPAPERAALRARQGVTYPVQEALGVFDRESGAMVPSDGVTLGEVRMRGNITMMGYLKDRDATAAAFAGGWFASGDLGVRHPDGYVELKDRLKDIIISGGENISTIEVETVLYRHPAVLEAAVVAAPDPHWGEVPCAFVTLREGVAASEGEIIAWCRARMATFKAPKRVVFRALPKTSTGKIQKFALRALAKGEGFTDAGRG